MAAGEYQTKTSVESSAGMPSTGVYWEKLLSSAARPHAGSSSRPSTVSASSMRGTLTEGRPGVSLWVARSAVASPSANTTSSGRFQESDPACEGQHYRSELLTGGLIGQTALIIE